VFLAGEKRAFSSLSSVLTSWALRYHSLGAHGKVGILSTKQVGTAAELSVAYSPGFILKYSLLESYLLV